MVKGLAFVMLGTGDVDRSAAFYRDVLGLTMTARFGDFAFLDTGTVTLVVTSELANSNTVQNEACEVVFAVESVQAAYDRTKDRLEFLNEPRPVNDTNWAVNFRDPDGHLLSLYGAQ